MRRWNSSRPSFEQEVRKYYVVPKSKELTKKGAWQNLYRTGRANDLVWKPGQQGSMPPLDRKGSPSWVESYDKLRKVIRAGEKLCKGAIVTHSKQETENIMRGGKSVRTEYEIVGVAMRAKVCPDCYEKTCVCRERDTQSQEAAAERSNVDVRTLPAPEPLPTPFRVLFIGANVDKHVELKVKEECKAVQQALLLYFGEFVRAA